MVEDDVACVTCVGEIISGDEGEDDDDDAEVDDDDEDTYMQKQRDKLEAEKESILNNKNLIAEVLSLSLHSLTMLRSLCVLDLFACFCIFIHCMYTCIVLL